MAGRKLLLYGMGDGELVLTLALKGATIDAAGSMITKKVAATHGHKHMCVRPSTSTRQYASSALRGVTLRHVTSHRVASRRVTSRHVASRRGIVAHDGRAQVLREAQTE